MVAMIVDTIHGGLNMGNELFEKLQKAIKEFDGQAAESLTKQAMQEKMDPIQVLDALTDAIREVGDGFGKGELFLPELVGAANAMQKATPILEEEIKKSGAQRESAGKVVIGSVHGDMHNIGKTMVGTLLTADGFEVIDLGINVETQQFIRAVKEHNANIVAMSALLTTTAQEQKNVIEALKAEGLRDSVKIMVGGGAISEGFAESIGADGYDPTAPGAVDLARKFVEK
jgi:corrinoid protein of di/trimethylamine methyltransferase